MRTSSIALLALATSFVAGPVVADPCFVSDVDTGLPQLRDAVTAWGDVDGDGDLDLLLAGGYTYQKTAALFLNQDGQFVDAGMNIPTVESAAIDWGDYDGDNDLDAVITGSLNDGSSGTMLFRNDDGVLTQVSHGLAHLSQGDVRFGDYDGDGDFDLAIAGFGQGTQPELRIYFREDDAYVEQAHDLPGLVGCKLEWVDLDKDGDLDLFMAGVGSGGPLVGIAMNEDGQFELSTESFPQATQVGFAFGDMDLDGDQDLALIGNPGDDPYATWIYRNDGGVLVAQPGPYPEFAGGGVAWGDADGDGDLDLALCGFSSDLKATILINDAGVLEESGEVLPFIYFSHVDWIDYDGDYDFDLVFAGFQDALPILSVYENDCGDVADPPGAPTGMQFTVDADSVYIEWEPGADPDTPPEGITVNGYFVDVDGGHHMLGTLTANLETGRKLDRRPGNLGQRTSLHLPRGGTPIVEWFLQSVDATGLGSPFTRGESDPSDWTCITPVDSLVATSKGMSFVDVDGNGLMDVVNYVEEDFSRRTYVAFNSPTGLGKFVQVAPEPYDPLDFDADGDLDFVRPDFSYGLMGMENRSGNWSSFAMPAPWSDTQGITGAPLWADVNRDGFPDLVAVEPMRVRIWAGTGSSFELLAQYDHQVRGGLHLVVAGDVDGDHVDDLVFIANDPSNELIQAAVLSFRDGRLLSQAVQVPPDILFAVPALGDLDLDGDLDAIVYGAVSSTSRRFLLYENEGGALGPGRDFDAFRPELGGWWRDIDGDGSLDYVEGATVFRNTSGGWERYESHPRYHSKFLDAADLDGDFLVDLLASGPGPSGEPSFGISSAGTCWPANTPPAPPTGLWQTRTEYQMALGWDPAEDAQTPTSALTYELRVGTEPGADDVFRSYQSSTSGALFFERRGNMGTDTELEFLSDWYRRYHWSVRAIDSSGAMSPLATIEMADSLMEWGSGEQVYKAEWGDTDGDGDLDLVVEGTFELRHYRNDSGGLELAAVLATGVHESDLAWGDYDGDGDLDLAACWQSDVAGYTSQMTRVFENRGGEFLDSGVEAPGLRRAELDWIDFDLDGDEDLVIGGSGVEFDPVTLSARLLVLENAGGALQPARPLTESLWPDDISVWSLNAVDYDDDGDEDLVIFHDDANGWHLLVLKNDAGLFSPQYYVLPQATATRQAPVWADFDQDSSLDMYLAADIDGPANTGSGIFTLRDGAYSRIGDPTGSRIASAADYDGDGRPEVLAWVAESAVQWVPSALKAIRVGDGLPQDLMPTVPELRQSFVGRFLDFDNDGRMDIYASGQGVGGGNWHSAIAVNTRSVPNTPPVAPPALHIDRTGDQVTFSWDPGSDAETVSAGLSYNLIVGTSMGAMDIMPAHADPVTGRRHVPGLGNVGTRRSWTLTIPEGTPVCWGVQSIDAGYLGSPFSMMNADGTPTVVQSFEVAGDGAGCVVLRWAATQALDLQRQQDGAWTSVDARREVDGTWAASDCPTGPARYRLVDAGGITYATQHYEGMPSTRVRSGIHRVHPNPFNPSTTVEYAVDLAQHLAIGIFDTRGRLVRSLLDADVPAGLGRVDWDGRDSSGQLVAGGVYYVMLRGEGLRDVRKVALVK